MSDELTPPVGPDDHAQGPADAPVTLVEYGDFQCPYCGAAYPVIHAVQRAMGRKLRFVFRPFPLKQIHPNAEHAAELAEAAATKGKFWEMHALLFENQRALGTCWSMRSGPGSIPPGRPRCWRRERSRGKSARVSAAG